MLELLSPAGSPEAVVAAVQSGADAIYLGLGGFNARRGAKNFTEEEFLETAKYCRARGCKIYVALNTLVSDRELGEAVRLAQFVGEAGADAILVQDLGLAKVLRSVCPEMPLHASTQMSIHNLAGVYAAAELGMKRVVMARELNIEQIRYICSKSPVEIETFVHGALCFCHSGQCYMSAIIGRRSGNRGMCAQPCRMEYNMGRRMDGHPLSLKDNCLVNHLKELEDAGVACVKIEGRMKRPEYTAIVTDIYSKAIKDGSAPTESDMKRLEIAFSRDGFTDGYFTGKKNDMHGVRSEPDRDANKIFSGARRQYSSNEARRVPVDFYAAAKIGKPFYLLAVDGDGNKAAVTGPTAERAQHAGLTDKSVADQLYKTGGTPYKCREIKTMLEGRLFLPASGINDTRRRALEKLTEERTAPKHLKFGHFPEKPAETAKHKRPSLIFQVLNESQLTAELAALEPAAVYVPLQIICEKPEKISPFFEAGVPVAAVMPRVMTDTETDSVRSMLEKASLYGVREVLTGNLGQIALARHNGFDVRGDFGLNVFNSYTLETLKEAGLISATASFEMRFAQVRELSKSVDTELIVYGRLPCMVTDQCIIRQASGGCSCGGKNHAISDRMGYVFPVVREFGCRNVIYNAYKLYLADKPDDINGAGLWAARLMFTTESPRECAQIAKSYMGLSDYRPNGLTRGLYYRGVE